MHRIRQSKKYYINKEEDLYLSKKYLGIDDFFSKPSQGYSDLPDISLKEKITNIVRIPQAKKITLEINSNKIIELPPKFGNIVKAIEESKYILELHDDFDDEGSKGYQFSTWIRAIDFLISYCKKLSDIYRIIIDTPKIYHGPDGSIDILWETDSYKLLINIPAEKDVPASFYGDDFKMDKIKGTFDTSQFNLGLLILLSKQK